RHTISKRDWSSDVCSSDLTGLINFTLNIILFTFSVKYLDKKEIIYTLIAIVVSSTALFYTEGVETVFTSDTLLASVFAGLFVGKIGRASCRESVSYASCLG